MGKIKRKQTSEEKLEELYADWEKIFPNKPPLNRKNFITAAWVALRMGDSKPKEWYDKHVKADQSRPRGDDDFVRHVVQRFNIAKNLRDEPDSPFYSPDRKG